MDWFGKVWKNSRDKGQYYERIAEKHLKAHGLKPLQRNVHNSYGEIDLIMQEGKCIVFVEVKFRKTSGYGGARYALGTTKQQRLKRAVACYVKEQGLNTAALRIDFVAIEGENADQLTWIKNVI